MDIKRKEEIKELVLDVADGKLDEEDAVEQIVRIAEEYTDEMLVSRVEKHNQDTD